MVSSERGATRARTSAAASETGSPYRSKMSQSGVPPRPATAQASVGEWGFRRPPIEAGSEEEAQHHHARFDEDANQIRQLTQHDFEAGETRSEIDTLAGVSTRVRAGK